MKQIPRHFDLWPAVLQKMWIKQHRPEEFKRIFRKEANVKTNDRSTTRSSSSRR